MTLPRSTKRWVAAVCVLLASYVLTAQTAVGQGGYSESAVEAVLLERIASFLEWPADTDDTVIDLVVLGRDRIGDQLSAIFARRQFAGRTLRLRYALRATEVGDADIVFISRQHSEDLGEVLRRCEREGLLTVADTNGYAQRGVAVNFYRDGTKVRFEIRPESLKRAGIRASYKLMTLARVVGGT